MVHPIWDTSMRRVASSIILEIDLQYYMASSHMHHIKLHHPIMSQSCVYKWHTQHVMCDELQSTHTQKGLLHLSYIPRDLDYSTSHNTYGRNEFTPLYIENGYKGYNNNDACGITLFIILDLFYAFKWYFTNIPHKSSLHILTKISITMLQTLAKGDIKNCNKFFFYCCIDIRNQNIKSNK